VAGARIEATFDDAELVAGFERVAQLTQDFRPLLKRIGVGLVHTTLARFESAQDPLGQPWHPLSRAYAQRKKGPGILRERAMRGGLMGSISAQIVGPASVAIGSNKVYAAIHQFGGTFDRQARTITSFRKLKSTGEFAHGGRFVKKKNSNFSQTHQAAAHRMTMPARPYLGFGPADRAAAFEAVTWTIGRLLNGKR
jgi:phage virion morphogenesis protein